MQAVERRRPGAHHHKDAIVVLWGTPCAETPETARHDQEDFAGAVVDYDRSNGLNPQLAWLSNGRVMNWPELPRLAR